MRHIHPDNLLRFNLHLRRDHIDRIASLADKLAGKKGRDVRLGEALELALIVGLNWSDADLLGLSMPDSVAPHWLELGAVDRFGGKALLPAKLRS